VLVVLVVLVMGVFLLLLERPILVMLALEPVVLLAGTAKAAVRVSSLFVTHTHKDQHVSFC
jgi:hypothetical protein